MCVCVCLKTIFDAWWKKMSIRITKLGHKREFLCKCLFVSSSFFFFNQPTCPFKNAFGVAQNMFEMIDTLSRFRIWQHVCIFCSVVMSDLLRTSRASCRRAADPSQQRRCVLKSVPLARTRARSSCGGMRETEEAIQSDWAPSSVLLTCKILSLLIGVIPSRSVTGHMVIAVPFFDCAVSWMRVRWIGVEGTFGQEKPPCVAGRWLKRCTHTLTKVPLHQLKSSFNLIWAHFPGVFVLKRPRKRHGHENIFP